MTPDSETPITQAACTDFVHRYLAGQDWQLVDPFQLANEIWENSAEHATYATVRTEIIRRYAAELHDRCLDSETSGSFRAWQELRIWLEKSASRLENHPPTRQEIIQETLIALQNSLTQSPLQNPHSFLSYALRTLRRQHIDWNRRQTAEKRDWRNTIALEELDKSGQKEGDGQKWDEFLTTSSSNWRTIEGTVSNQEVRQQLLQFAQEHLPTNLQQDVFEAHFLDGLQPAEIARLFGKQPHEIRMIKARTVKRIKELPLEEIKKLLNILGRLESNA
ncbi:MAG: sigma-70 family RNA polymerase sigma factor [Candidatus Promineifilaceae bacterium]